MAAAPLLVVGGTYLERTDEPDRSVLFGSGLRAAAALGSIHPQLVTCLDSDTEELARSVATGYDVDVVAVRRAAPLAFHYYTAISRPTISGYSSVAWEPVNHSNV